MKIKTVAFVAAFLLIVAGIIMYVIVQEQNDRTYTPNEAYVLFLRDGLGWKHEIDSLACVLPFLSIAGGIALGGITLSLTVGQKSPFLGRVIQLFISVLVVLLLGMASLMVLIG